MALTGRFAQLPQSLANIKRDHPFLTGMNCEVVTVPSVGFLDMLRRDRPTIVGTPGFASSNLGMLSSGPGLSFNSGGGSSAGYLQFTGRTSASSNGNTFAGIFMKNATNNSGLGLVFSFETSLNTGWNGTTTFNNGGNYSQFYAGTQQGSNVALTNGTPYFVVASTEAKGAGSAWYFKIKDLQSGLLIANQSGTATVTAGGAGSWSFLGSQSFGYALTGYGYFATMGSKYLKPEMADAWIRDPMQIFVPSRSKVGVFISASTVPYWAFAGNNSVIGVGVN